MAKKKEESPQEGKLNSNIMQISCDCVDIAQYA
jgi:hypothetical protein